jgi:hypothetical protein
MVAGAIGRVPLGHQGDADEVSRRIESLGTSAILAFDGDTHRTGPVARAPARRPLAQWTPRTALLERLRSPRATASGRHDPLFCCHVGQLDDTET